MDDGRVLKVHCYLHTGRLNKRKDSFSADKLNQRDIYSLIPFIIAIVMTYLTCQTILTIYYSICTVLLLFVYFEEYDVMQIISSYELLLISNSEFKCF